MYNWFKKIYVKLDPLLIKGMVLGICCCVIAVLIFQLENVFLVLSFSLAILICLLVGVLIGSLLFKENKDEIEAKIDNFSTEISKELDALKTDGKLNFIDLLRQSEKAKDLFGKSLKVISGLLLRAISLTTLVTTLGGVVSLAIFVATYMQVQRLDTQNDLLEKQNNRIDIQSYLLESQRRAGFQQELTRVLDLISLERAAFDKDSTNTNGDKLFSLSLNLFGRVNFLTRAFKPYYYIEISTDSDLVEKSGRVRVPKLTNKPTSVERGQLFLALVNAGVNLGDESWVNADFSYADLQQAQILPLNPIDITSLKLDNTSFRNSRITNVNFWGTSLKSVEFKDAELSSIFIENSDLSNSDFTNSSWSNISIQQSNLENAILKQIKVAADLEIVECSYDQVLIDSLWICNTRDFSLDSISTMIELLDIENYFLDTADTTTFFGYCNYKIFRKN